MRDSEGPGAPVPGGRRPREPRRGRWSALRLLGLLGLAGFLAVAFTPLTDALHQAMAGTARLEPADAIVVLGRGGVDTDGILSNSSLRRALHGIDLYRRGLAPALVFSGGPAGARRQPAGTEAALRAQLAQALGIPPRAVLVAPPGRTTRDEAVQVRRLLSARGVERILLVADPIDMPRTRATFAHVGFLVLPAPTAAGGPSTPEGRLALFRDVSIEALAWLYYRTAGYLGGEDAWAAR